MMSPPCQPFTRGGAKRDHADTRTMPLLHLMTLLSQMEDPPAYFLLENVKGFEGSVSHALVLHALTTRGYVCTQYMLCPTQFGIPNERVRYYITAHRRQPLPPAPLPPIESITPVDRDNIALMRHIEGSEFFKDGVVRATTSIEAYLDHTADDNAGYEVPLSLLHKSGQYKHDMVAPHHTTSSCFTKAYTRNYLGTGPLLILPHPSDITTTTTGNITYTANGNSGRTIVTSATIDPVPSTTTTGTNNEAELLDDSEHRANVSTEALNEREDSIGSRNIHECSVARGDGDTTTERYIAYTGQRLRFFTPKEIARLLGFKTYDSTTTTAATSSITTSTTTGATATPTTTTSISTTTAHAVCIVALDAVSDSAAYALLGNSLNCVVVAELVRSLFRKASLE